MDLFALITHENLDLISRHCPGALSTYTALVNRSDENHKVFISKKEVEIFLHISPTVFRNNLRKLAYEGLLEWGEINKGYAITLNLEG